MQAFHNNPAIKAFYLDRVHQHQQADEIIQGVYWQNGRGCAVGCTLHSNEHGAYETELGIPRQLAYLQDRIFEGLPAMEAKTFPHAFLEAIPVGADLSLVIPRFLIWLLEDEKSGTLRLANVEGKQATKTVIALYKRVLVGEEVSKQEWLRAAYDAYDAGYAGYAAANANADAAYAANANADAAYASANAAAYAGYAAYASANAAAYAAAYAANAAERDAAAYAAAYAAYAAERDADERISHYKIMRDKLLELLRGGQ